jgi:predicted dehydrogenase/nucleoside-diphosphate-sugar epimerase
MVELRVGIIGAGYVSGHHLRALASIPTIKVVGIADLNRSRAEQVAKSHALPNAVSSAEELFSLGVDVAHVLTPPASHSSVAIRCMQEGVHVLVEKPMAETSEQCAEMIATSQSCRRILGLIHSGRFDPVVLRGVDIVRKGTIGSIVSLDFHRSSDYPPWSGQGSLPPYFQKGSYPFQDLGIHGLAIAEAFLGQIESCDVRFRSSGADPNLTFDEWLALVDCEQGQARLYFSWNVRPVGSRIIVHGTRGALEIDCILQTCHVTRVLPGPKFLSPVVGSIWNSAANLYQVPLNVLRYMTGRLPGAPGIHQNIRDFYAALQNGGTQPVSPEEGLRLVSAMSAASEKADRERDAIRMQQLSPRASADILVTGAGGFLGRALLHRLHERGDRIRAAVRRMPDRPLPGVQYVVGDLGDPAYVQSLVRGVGSVIHVAAAMKGYPEDFQRGTVVATQNLIDSCLKYRVRRLVHVSSLSVLDHARKRLEKVTESWPLEPYAERRGAYTQTKLKAEQIVLHAIDENGLSACVVRPGVIFGPGVEKSSPAGSFSMFGRWVVVGNGSLPLPLVYVDDVVDALLLAADSATITARLVNLVDPIIITQREFVKSARLRHPTIKASYVPKQLLLLAALGIEMAGRILKRDVPLSRYRIQSIRPLGDFDLTIAREHLGWAPRVGVREGLKRTFGGTDAHDQNCGSHHLEAVN